MSLEDRSALEAEQTADDAKQRDGLGFLWFIAKVVIVVFLFRVLVFSAFYIPSESMMPTLLRGDYLVIAKWSYGYSKYSIPFGTPLPEGRLFAALPKRGDIAVFKHPLDRSDYIKRVVGLPGDRVELRDGQFFLNGDKVPREEQTDFAIARGPYASCNWGRPITLPTNEEGCRFGRSRERLDEVDIYEILDSGKGYADDFGPKIVPAGHLFVMGDHRDNSQDSRFPLRVGGGTGFVPIAMLVGRADRIVFSTDGHADWSDPASWFRAARWNRIGNEL